MPHTKLFFFDNKPVDLSHLGPFQFSVQTPSKATRRIFVSFSPHTFTRAFADGDTPDQLCFDRRVFSPERYALSFGLKGIVQGLADARVFQTWERRSYVYLAVKEVGAEGRTYHVFFSLKRRKHPAGVNLYVESAYRKHPSEYTPPKRPNAIRFGLLVEKVFAGQPLKFR